MNIERGFKVAKKRLTSDYLADSLWNFADRLAAHRWNHDKIREVGISRSVAEYLGYEGMAGNEEVFPVYNEVLVDFAAEKRDIEDGEWIAPYYRIKSTVSQDIERDEIPGYVLGEILEDARDEEEHPLNYVVEGYGIEGEVAEDSFEALALVRSQEAEYEINHEGEIEDFRISFSYLADNEIIHQVGYSSVDDDLTWVPIRLGDGTIRESKPLIIPVINVATIDSEIRGLDKEFESFLFEKSLTAITEMAAVSPEEHIRRVLGMLSLVASGFMEVGK